VGWVSEFNYFDLATLVHYFNSELVFGWLVGWSVSEVVGL